MARESAFDKKLTEESTMDKVEGLLEHFNLPPKVIDFIRKNQRTIQVVIGVIIVAVVAWSLYGSYRDKIKEESATALSLAMQADESAKAAGLQNVVEEYGSTSSALWARVELGHLDMKKGAFDEAAQKYSAILADVKKDNPLYPLLVFSLGQAKESQGNFAEAASQYDLLKTFTGYEHIGYVGLSRLEESQGDIDKAIAILNNFLLSVGDKETYAGTRAEVDAKIARLKTRQ